MLVKLSHKVERCLA